MVIQRIQSVWLLVAAILMVLVNFVGFEAPNGEELMSGSLSDFLWNMGVNYAATAAYFVAIFLFGNFKRQKTVLMVGFVLNMLAIVMLVSLMFTTATAVSEAFLPGVLMVMAAAFALMARKRIVADENLLKSADRIR